MTGANFNFALQRRDRRLLSELAVMRIADRDQLLTASGFPSIWRINKRVRKLRKAGLIRQSQFYLAGRPALYVLTSKGLAIAASEGEIDTTLFKPLHGSLFIEHQLRVNQVYLALKHTSFPEGIQFHLWKNCQEPLSRTAPIVPDGYAELNFHSHISPLFLEVDRGTEGLKDWKAKTEKYIRFALSGDFQESFHHPQFRVLVLTQTNTRMKAIQKTIASHTNKIFRLSTFFLINQRGLWSDVWVRPTDDQALPLSEIL